MRQAEVKQISRQVGCSSMGRTRRQREVLGTLSGYEVVGPVVSLEEESKGGVRPHLLRSFWPPLSEGDVNVSLPQASAHSL